jgi:hypothetical protein
MSRALAGRAPSAPTLPLTYLVTAAAAFVVAALAVPWLGTELAGHYYHPRLLALAHTATLGWVTLTIMGASYQLIPIVLEREVWSERLARWQLAFLVAGIVGMVGHFAIGRWSGLVWGAGLVALGIGLHLVNVALTVRGLGRWTFTARLVALALVGLALTALFGLALGIDKLWKFLPGALFANLHAHIHLALLGWVLPMVIGVAARVYPMFLLAREPDGWVGHAQFWGLALGVPLLVAGLLIERTAPAVAGALLVTAAVAGHLAWVGEMVWRRKRPSLDWGLRFVLTGATFLPAATGLGLGFAADLWSGPRLGLGYAILALGGWVSLTIVGMMLKIVPFLVWYRAYGPHVGRRPVPTLAELGWPAGEGAAYVLLTTGLAALAIGTISGRASAITGAGLLVAAGALAFGLVLIRVLGHLRSLAHTAPAPQARAS